MRIVKLAVACIVLPVYLAGCATADKTMNDNAFGGDDRFKWCIVGGAVAGGVAGGLTGDGYGALIGIPAGAVLGQLLCEPSDMAMAIADEDGDGVPDGKDKCPGTPKIARHAVGPDGCPLYTDADSVPDYLDRCPGTPAGVKTDKWGCPFDSDGDGVYDYLDKCPNTPKGTVVDDNGCPEVGEKIAIITNVNFDFDKSNIRADARQKLDKVVELLKENPEVKVRIVGHTDSTGPENYNLGLSERRALSVRKYLQEKGISITRLSVRGVGEAQPLVSNKTRSGRAVNRRVEFEVVD